MVFSKLTSTLIQRFLAQVNVMSVTKIPLIITAALANHVMMTPPTPPPATSEIVKDVTLGERIFTKGARILPMLAKVRPSISDEIL